MKKKDIIVLAISGIVIVVCIYFVSTGLGGSGSKQTKTEGVTQTTEFNSNIDNGAIQKIQERKDYGSVPMDGIGRDNPFGGL